MKRSETTAFLYHVLIKKLLDEKRYYSTEVTIDFNTNHSKRIDILEFTPKGTTYASDIEKGIFTVYEIKSCIEDVFSGNGLNFIGEKNYIVCTIDTCKKCMEKEAELKEHICKVMGVDVCPNFGYIVPTNIFCTTKEEWECPSAMDNYRNFDTWTVKNCKENRRTRSMTELLFCMLRSR